KDPQACACPTSVRIDVTNISDDHCFLHNTNWTAALIHQSVLASQLGATFHDAQYITCPSTRVSPLQDNEFAFCTKRFVQSATKPVRSTFVIEFSFDDEPAG